MKDLPNVSAFEINKKINNSQERYESNQKDFVRTTKENIPAKINNIFASNNHIIKSRVKIKTVDGTYEKIIIGKTSTELLTITGEKIRIIDIIDIEKSI